MYATIQKFFSLLIGTPFWAKALSNSTRGSYFWQGISCWVLKLVQKSRFLSIESVFFYNFNTCLSSEYIGKNLGEKYSNQKESNHLKKNHNYNEILIQHQFSAHLFGPSKRILCIKTNKFVDYLLTQCD